MSLPRLLVRLRRPVAVAALVLLGLGLLLSLTGPTPPNRDAYAALYRASLGVATLLLLVLALVPDGVARRIRLGCLVPAGLALAVLQGNGFTEGLPRVLLAAAAALALGFAVPALVVTLESDRNRSVSRF